MSDQETMPWQKQKGESRQAYGSFILYRDMGRSRSLAKVSRECGKHVTLLGRWSRRWGWVARAEAYDEEQDNIGLEAEAEAIREMKTRHAQVAKLFQSKLVEKLRTITPAELSPSHLATWLQISTQVERLARGEPTVKTVTVDEEAGKLREFLDEVLRDQPELRRQLAFKVLSGGVGDMGATGVGG